MALQLILENLDGIDDAQKQLYVERDGKFHLDVDGVEDTTGLKSALEKERAARREFEKKYGALKNVDPDEYAKLKREAEEREQKKLEDKGEFEKLREKWAQKEEQMKTDYEKKLSEKDGLLKKLVLEDRMRQAALKAGIRPDRIDDVMSLTSARANMDDSGAIRILDENGDPTTETPFDFYAKTYKSARPDYFVGSNASGSGATPGGTGGGLPKSMKRSSMTDQEKTKFIGEHGLQAFQQLPA